MRHFARLRKLRFLVCLGVLATCVLVLGLMARQQTPVDAHLVAADPTVRHVAAANTEFGFRLLTQLNRQSPDTNVFFSPFSVSDALTMALNGAGGATQRDMASTLGLKNMTQAQFNHANGLLLPSLTHPDPKVELSVANALWANTGTKFDTDFQKRCTHFYDARTDMLDFNSPSAAERINDWVSNNTHGKIGQLVSPPDLAGAEAVLTNAVYFHGQWSQAFEKSSTQNGPFTLTKGGTKIVPLMSQEGSFSYLETPKFQAVSMPYGAGRMSFYVLLPKAGSSLNELLSGMNKTAWEGWIRKMQPTKMAIILPRFKASYEATLNSPLTALGMGSVFDSKADFSPMGLHGSAISKVLHKAIIEVDEQGTVAAAATDAIMTASIELPPQIVMRVDHPFFCAIRDNTTGTLLFAGVIRNPA